MGISIYIAIITFIYGIVIGSFLNVCIYRIPLKESVAKESSHCMKCGYKLQWYDLIPLLSYVMLGGKCRVCKEHISKQYFIIELMNGISYVWLYLIYGISMEFVLYSLCVSALIVISVIDWRTKEIPVVFNIFILILGMIRIINDLEHWQLYVIGFFAVSVLLYIMACLGAMGGGDVKLMAAAGLLIGWKYIILALVLGCVLGSIIHIALMKITNAEHVLAFGPYLSLGIFITMLYGSNILEWYLSMF